MKTIGLIFFGLAVLLISAGFYALSEAQLEDLPRKPVAELLIAERKNVEEIRDLAGYGVIAGAVILGSSVVFIVTRSVRGR